MKPCMRLPLTWPEAEGANEPHEVGKEGQRDGDETNYSHVCGQGSVAAREISRHLRPVGQHAAG